MNYFNLIFSNKSILRIFQQEIFKKFKIEGEIIEFGASDETHKNFCYNLKNCKITYYDPSGEKKEFKYLKNVKYSNSSSTACLNADLIILHTEWNDFKLLNFKKLVKKNNFKVFDMRNIYSPSKMKKSNIKYFGIGR